MALPAAYYQLVYDEKTGDVLSFWNPMRGECPDSPYIEVSLEDHARVQPAPFKFRVIDKRLVEVSDIPKDERPKRPAVSEAIIAGLVIDGVCYALDPKALAVLTLDLSRGSKTCRAIAHTPTGNQLVTLPKEDAKNVASMIADHLVALHCG
ncbi:hypothetical protein O152_gp235 [Pseudomonas phage PaBG]|uniref:Uncharacterized protein n=1 Tax=Pseudomonas phage PaBG TaxID=1335230 RepID=S5WKM7_9CAUD|nr:hypothetical protein O152_gp235 [Pseudomonas phage PaBG]AGS82126.1 hypothetical protein PaBG_00251 [Pseudomonas phage PaBG]